MDQDAATARGRATRKRLLSATTDLVKEVGYAQTTVRAVARAAGIAEGTIYRHFPDKSSLLLAAVVAQFEPIAEWMSQLPARAGEGELADTLTECLTRLASLRERLLPLELAMLTDPELSAARDQKALPAGAPDPPAMLAEYLAAEQDLGRLRADVDPTEAATLILVTLFGLAIAPSGPSASTAPPTIRRVVELLLEGLAP